MLDLLERFEDTAFELSAQFLEKPLDGIKLVGERIEDPFENRLEDVPLTALSLTIETNLKEQWGDKDFPQLKDYPRGVVL